MPSIWGVLWPKSILESTLTREQRMQYEEGQDKRQKRHLQDYCNPTQKE